MHLGKLKLWLLILYKYKKGRNYLVGYVGVIGEQEGLDLLIAAVKHITKTRQDVQFAIIGGGTELENIKRLSLKNNVEGFVDFYGRVPGNFSIYKNLFGKDFVYSRGSL